LADRSCEVPGERPWNPAGPEPGTPLHLVKLWKRWLYFFLVVGKLP